MCGDGVVSGRGGYGGSGDVGGVVDGGYGGSGDVGGVVDGGYGGSCDIGGVVVVWL